MSCVFGSTYCISNSAASLSRFTNTSQTSSLSSLLLKDYLMIHMAKVKAKQNAIKCAWNIRKQDMYKLNHICTFTLSVGMTIKWLHMYNLYRYIFPTTKDIYTCTDVCTRSPCPHTQNNPEQENQQARRQPPLHPTVVVCDSTLHKTTSPIRPISQTDPKQQNITPP